LNIEFEKGAPFTPLLQLLSVLPPQSGSFLPPSYEDLMTSSQSPLAPFYPKDFEVDANGKKNAWECVVRIPFLDSSVLLDEVSQIDHISTLSETERLRNILGTEHRFQPTNKSTSNIQSLSQSEKQSKWGNALVEHKNQNKLKR
jgi:5'-3' exonuclease